MPDESVMWRLGIGKQRWWRGGIEDGQIPITKYRWYSNKERYDQTKNEGPIVMADIYGKEKRSEIMRSVRNKNTLPELIVQSILRDLEIPYERETLILHCRPDIIIPDLRKVIFINGCFWHGHSCKRGQLPETNRIFWETKILKNTERDARNYVELEEAGWSFLVIWGCEIKKKNIEFLKDKISSFLI